MNQPLNSCTAQDSRRCCHQESHMRGIEVKPG
jgi:hypothetical protein